MATLSSLGIGSGLDTAAMLEQMRAAEQTRLNPYTTLKAATKTKFPRGENFQRAFQPANQRKS